MKLDPRILKIRGYMELVDLQWMLDTSVSLPSGSTVIEIGSLFGRSSAAWCQGAGDEKTVVCIDTWEGTPDTVYKGGPLEAYMTEDVFAQFQSNMSSMGFSPRVLRMDSVEAAKLFSDRSVDLVFVDGDHYKVVEDLDAWVPKIKIGGLICGHDWHASPWHISSEVLPKYPDADYIAEGILIWGFVIKDN